MYRDIFDVAHQSHCGIHPTLAQIKREFFWPDMRQTVEDLVRGCSICCKHRFRKPDTSHKWPSDTHPWTRVHIDWAYLPKQGNILVVVDSYSGWLEAMVCRNRETATVITTLRQIFARFGIPQTLVSDNAPEFTSSAFHGWLNSISCRVVHSPEYHPQSNGLAERMVRVVKEGIATYNPSKSTFEQYLQRLLMVHRNTANRQGQTPAQIMLGRSLRCPILGQLRPYQEIIYKAQKEAAPKSAEMLFRTGANTNLIKLQDGRSVVAHDSQITSAPVPEDGRPRRERRAVHRYPDVDPRSEGRERR